MKQANPRWIGAFVLGGVLIAVAAVLVFTSQDFLAKKRRFVAYFQQSVKGLRVGAPVQFRGIPIGEVIAIDGVYESEKATVTPRITLEVRPETLLNAELPDDPTAYPLLPAMEAEGMRATLKSQSLLTGQLYVALDFHPEAPVRKLGGEVDEYPEMPTLDSGFEEALEKLQDLPIEALLDQARDTLTAVEVLARDPRIAETLESLDALLADSDALMVRLTTLVDSDVSPMLGAARGSLDRLTQRSLPALEGTIGETAETMAGVRERLAADGALHRELVTALQEVSRSARAIRDLADFIEQHPESILRGKGN